MGKAKKRRRSKQRHIPYRTCVGCREKKPKRALVRIVRTPEGDVVVDEAGKAQGRGAYLCRNAACWETALKRGSLGRALRTSLRPEAVEALRAHAEAFQAEAQRAAGHQPREG